MNNLEILECAQSIHDFIIGDLYLNESLLNKQSFQNMNETLSKYDTDILTFTKFLNSKYKIYNEPIWNYEQQTTGDFFITKGSFFYKTILRELKINLTI